MTKNEAMEEAIKWASLMIRKQQEFHVCFDSKNSVIEVGQEISIKYEPIRRTPTNGTMVRSGSWIAFSTGEVNTCGNLVCRRMGLSGRMETIEMSDWEELLKYQVVNEDDEI